MASTLQIENIVESETVKVFALTNGIEVGIEIGTGEWTVTEDGDSIDWLCSEDSALLLASAPADRWGVALDATGGNHEVAEALVVVTEAEVQSWNA